MMTWRIIGFSVHAGVLDGPVICRLFNQIILETASLPRSISSDNDPLLEFHRWKANLRILEVDELKTVPYVPLSHPFIERKLHSFQKYFNRIRVHRALTGTTPDSRDFDDPKVIRLNDYRWKPWCHGLYQLPAAA